MLLRMNTWTMSRRAATRLTVLLAAAAVAFTIAAVAWAGAKPEVELKDLSKVGETQLGSLKDAEHAVTLAETNLEGAKGRAKELKTEMKDAKDAMAAAKANISAAKAEHKAAKTNADDGRKAKAGADLETAKVSLGDAKAKLQWATKEADYQHALSTQYDAEVDMRRAELELARVRLLHESGDDSSGKYLISDFEVQLDKAQASWAKAEAKANKSHVKAEQAQSKWQGSKK